MREHAADIAHMLRDANTCIYVCGLEGMEDSVLQVLRDIAEQRGLEGGPL
jgi:sulfite reductase alpha subunit-like flavoprotein